MVLRCSVNPPIPLTARLSRNFAAGQSRAKSDRSRDAPLRGLGVADMIRYLTRSRTRSLLVQKLSTDVLLRYQPPPDRKKLETCLGTPSSWLAVTNLYPASTPGNKPTLSRATKNLQSSFPTASGTVDSTSPNCTMYGPWHWKPRASNFRPSISNWNLMVEVTHQKVFARLLVVDFCSSQAVTRRTLTANKTDLNMASSCGTPATVRPLDCGIATTHYNTHTHVCQDQNYPKSLLI